MVKLTEELKSQWDEERNGLLIDYKGRTKDKVWWKCETIEHHRWKTAINNRVCGKGCPICKNQLICPIDQCNSLYYSANDLIKKEWNKEKNGSMKEYTQRSGKKVYWKCNKYNHHIWQASIGSRTKKSPTGCPICKNQLICPIDQCNSLYYHSTDIVKKEWDIHKNGSMKNYSAKSNKKVYWICSKNSHHRWESTIHNRDKHNCPICVNQMICPIDQCNSLYYNANDMIKKEWDKEKNGSMKNYLKSTDKKVWWICSNNNHHKWVACPRTIYQSGENNNNGCPFCANKRICEIDYCNSLLNNCKEFLKKEWNEEKNGSMKNYFPGSSQKVWWKCLDNEHHEWEAIISSRNKKNIDIKCAICTNKIICPVDQCNSAYYNCSDDIISKWDEETNGSMKNYTRGSQDLVSWKCADIEHHKWKTSINDMCRNSKCKICINTYMCTIDYCNSLINNCSDELKQEWDEKKNGSMKNYTQRSSAKVNWICLIDKSHIWSAEINKRLDGERKCPTCNLCPKCQLWCTMGKLCSYCKPKSKYREKTKEMEVVKFLKDNLQDYDFIHNKSVGADCTGGHLFPDIRFDCIHYFIIVEVDEFKHRGASYKCDQQRMYDIISKLGLPCIFIRYNPDNKKSNKQTLLKTIKKYINTEDKVWDDYGFKVDYLFY